MRVFARRIGAKSIDDRAFKTQRAVEKIPAVMARAVRLQQIQITPSCIANLAPRQ